MNKISERGALRVWDQSEVIIVCVDQCTICKNYNKLYSLTYIGALTNKIVSAMVQKDIQEVLAIMQQKVDLVQDTSQPHVPSDSQTQFEHFE